MIRACVTDLICDHNQGYPGSAERVLKAIEAGVDYTRTATIKFPEGSYGNGGAMRMSFPPHFLSESLSPSKA